MPPGIGDATLDIIRLIMNIKFLIITTSSQLAFETVRKLMNLLNDLKVPVMGVVENMKVDAANDIRRQVQGLGVAFLGGVPFDKEIEGSMGKVDKLLKTIFAEKVGMIASKM
jgi:Mrp family chromosome partitioning ATPase